MAEKNNDDDNNRVENDRDWSSLPDEIWAMIGGRLVSFPLDVLRFRSVCSFFRSLFPHPPFSSAFPSPPPLPRFSFPVPSFSSSADAFVSRTTLFRLDRPFCRGGPHLAGWLLKVQDPLPHRPHSGAAGGGGKFRLFDPLSCHRIKDLITTGDGDGDGGGLHLNDFSLTELTTSYSLRYVCGSASIGGVNKLIPSPHSSSASAIFLIYDNGKLGFAKNGDDGITLIDDKILDFNDIILHRNQPYVVDRWGTVSWINKSLNLIQYSPPLFGLGHRKHLVAGEPFFIVDRYLDVSHDNQYPSEAGVNFNALHRHPRRRRRFDESVPKTVDFKVYKLDEECGKWVEVKCLGEQAFVLSYDCCFAIRAKEYVGFRKNCIYFTEQFDMDFALRRLGRLGGCVFSLEDRTIEDLPCTPGYSQLFWPPPIPTRLCTGRV